MNSYSLLATKQICFVAVEKSCSLVHFGEFLAVFGRFLVILT